MIVKNKDILVRREGVRAKCPDFKWCCKKIFILIFLIFALKVTKKKVFQNDKKIFKVNLPLILKFLIVFTICTYVSFVFPLFIFIE